MQDLLTVWEPRNYFNKAKGKERQVCRSIFHCFSFFYILLRLGVSVRTGNCYCEEGRAYPKKREVYNQRKTYPRRFFFRNITSRFKPLCYRYILFVCMCRIIQHLINVFHSSPYPIFQGLFSGALFT